MKDVIPQSIWKNVNWKEAVRGVFPWSVRCLSEKRLLENIIHFKLTVSLV